MIYKVKIYQPYEPTFMVRENTTYKKEDYNHVWTSNYLEESEINMYEFLEHIFAQLNMGQHPENYRGHSLSVGDLVQVNDDLYVVGNIGFKKIEWGA